LLPAFASIGEVVEGLPDRFDEAFADTVTRKDGR